VELGGSHRRSLVLEQEAAAGAGLNCTGLASQASRPLSPIPGTDSKAGAAAEGTDPAPNEADVRLSATARQSVKGA